MYPRVEDPRTASADGPRNLLRVVASVIGLAIAVVVTLDLDRNLESTGFDAKPPSVGRSVSGIGEPHMRTNREEVPIELRRRLGAIERLGAEPAPAEATDKLRHEQAPNPLEGIAE